MNSLKKKPSNQGGKRPGAGRPKKPLVILRKATAEGILSSIDEPKAWSDILMGDDLRARLDALKYLTDRRDGKAPQSVDMTSGGQPLAAPVLNITFVDADSVSS